MTLAAFQGNIPAWAVVLFWIGMLIYFVRSVRRAEKRRRELRQPHTAKDSALLLLSALIVSAIVFAGFFYSPNHALFSRPFFFGVMLVIGGGLTFVFNHHWKRK